MIAPEELHKIIEQSARRYKLEVSKQAEELIYATLNALIEDPNPRWAMPESIGNELVQDYVSDIGFFIAIMAGDPDAYDLYFHEMGRPPLIWRGRYPRWRRYRFRNSGKIGYFDVLHFIAENLTWLNPFPKE